MDGTYNREIHSMISLKSIQCHPIFSHSISMVPTAQGLFANNSDVVVDASTILRCLNCSKCIHIYGLARIGTELK